MLSFPAVTGDLSYLDAEIMHLLSPLCGALISEAIGASVQGVTIMWGG